MLNLDPFRLHVLVPSWLVASSQFRFFARPHMARRWRATCNARTLQLSGTPKVATYAMRVQWRSMYESLDWFKGKFTGNHGFYHQT